MKYLRPRPSAAALALLLGVAPCATVALGQSVAVSRSLESTPGDVIIRHSGRQAAEPWGEYLGQEVVTGDFNGDGKTDVAVSATGDSAPGDTSARRGRVYVYYGKGADFPALLDPAEQGVDCVIAGTESFSWFGTELVAGDFDGDGIDDLAVAENELRTVYVGRVYVISGARIKSSTSINVGAGEFDTKLTGRTTGSDAGFNLYFGFSLAAGDFNRDGLKDLAIGAFGGDGVSGSVHDSGEVAMFLGRNGGWAHEITAQPSTADLYIGGRFSNHLFGNELGAGDVDGDGADDLVVSAWGGSGPNRDRSNAGDLSFFSFASGSPVVLPAVNTGAVAPLGLVWSQGPLGVVHGPTVNARIGASASTEGGRGLAVGDVDGDGIGDIVVGAPFFGSADPIGHNTGGVFLVYGGRSLTSGAAIDLAAPGSGVDRAAAFVAVGETGASLGDAVRVADLNGDGRAEIIAGAPDASQGSGYAAVYGGRSRSLATTPAGTPVFSEPDALVRGYALPWRAGEDVFFVDASFAGRALVGIALPEGGRRPQGGGRGPAGELDFVDAASVAASIPRQPFVSGLPASATVRPGASLEIPLTAGGGTGGIASIAVAGGPAFARVEGGATPKLVLSPSATDRGAFDVTVVATDASGATGTRKVRVVVGFTPAITSARAKATGGSSFKLTVSGGGFSKGDAVVEVDGVALPGVKYPSKFDADGGQTVTRLVVKSTRLRAGASVVVRNPREGIASTPVALELQ